MTTVFETEVCTRCHGTGHYSFNGEHSRCYKCDGKNGARTYTKRGAAAKTYYEGKLMVPATEIKIGDKIRDMNVKQLTVASIEERKPNGRAWVSGVEIVLSNRIHFTNATGLEMSCEVDGLVRRIPTAEENEILIADAIAYQDTLTKAGTVRK